MKNCSKSLENPCIGFWACWLQWWWLEACLAKSLGDKVCILLNNGNSAKMTLISGFSTHTPSYPLLLPSSDEIWSLLKHPYPWPSHNKKSTSNLGFIRNRIEFYVERQPFARYQTWLPQVWRRPEETMFDNWQNLVSLHITFYSVPEKP